MVIAASTARALVGLLVLAPILAAVLITALLVFGVEPHLVFLPGHFVRSGLAGLGIHAPKQVGVLSTFVFWWAIIVAVWLTLRRVVARGHRTAGEPPDLEALVASHAQLIKLVAVKEFAIHTADADQIVQEVVLRILSSGVATPRAKSWVIAITRNVCIEYRRGGDLT
ncbi:MAG: hypothetical protein AABO58_18915 [Acidobacteriota bacterium]